MRSELEHTLDSPAFHITDVHSEPLESSIDFIDVAARFARLPGTVVLLSGGDLDCARYHVLGVMPWLRLAGRSNRTVVQVDEQEHILPADSFKVLRSVLHHCRLPAIISDEPLAAGLLGYLAYDLKDRLEDLPRTAVDELHLPDMLLFSPAVLVVHDKQQQNSRLLFPRRQAAAEPLERTRQRFYEMANTPAPEREDFMLSARNLGSNFQQPQYESAVRRIIDYIAAGDVYQVNLSQRFETDFRGSPFALFRHLYDSNPAPFFAYIQAGDHQVISTSPERFLLRRGSKVETRPIKGTRPRGSTPAQDVALRRELTESSKDDAELSMIVDLLRNDIGKVCRAGSVRVDAHKRLEAYRNVYHLVSVVTGELDAGCDSVDLIRATFPGGSITGCPKVRAMQIIDELETCRRHVYCGSIGYIGFQDTMDLSIAIRTATVVGDRLRFSVGGGVVYDSDPTAEYEETLHKGRTLQNACQAGRLPANASDTVWFNGRLLPRAQACVPVDDLGLQYGFGFFETIRADNGRAALLPDHLARFDRTWRALMPDDPPHLTWDVIFTQLLEANGLLAGSAALKLLATHGSRCQPPRDHCLLVSARPYTHRLAPKTEKGLRLATYPYPRQSPLAAHKTLNYLYYQQAGQWAQDRGYDEALVCNPDGTLSETNTANLLLIFENKAIRPSSPAALPGVMAEAVCRCLRSWGYEILQRPLEPEALLHADQVLATNALMGAVPVIGLDHTDRPAGGDLWQRLNKTIFPGWRI
jgi:para-aminobenzoate synthetase component 1